MINEVIKSNKIRVEKSYIPLIRKTKNVHQWTCYVNSQLRELRGYDKH